MEQHRQRVEVIVNWLLIVSLLIVVRATAPPTVNTSLGTVVGIEDDECIAFLGVPYAQPPSRWRPPMKLETFSEDPLIADSWKPMCYQVVCEVPPGACNPQVSEDCLFLNIYAPKQTIVTSNLGVMVFIHGGSFDAYTAGAELFHGGRMARKGSIIVVTINYRLNVFHGLFTGMSENDAHGNYGILDQSMAIKWVHEQIGNFGGNPNKITLAGQSAGAQALMLHLIDEELADMFAHVIIQSNPIALPFRTQDDAIKQGVMFAAELGCSEGDMDCMRAKDPESVYQAALRSKKGFSKNIITRFEPWVPVSGVRNIPEYIGKRFGTPSSSSLQAEKTIPGKPTILGTVENEAVPYIYEGFRSPISVAQYFMILVKLKKHHALALYLNYPSSNLIDTRMALATFATDFIFKCPTRMVANRMQSSSDVWLYNMKQTFLDPDIWTPKGCDGLACHGMDIPFLFQTIDRGGYKMTQSEEIMSDSMIYYFTNFVKTGNPNIGSEIDLAVWPKYTDTFLKRQQMVFQAGKNEIIHFPKRYTCNMWDLLRPYYAYLRID